MKNSTIIFKSLSIWIEIDKKFSARDFSILVQFKFWNEILTIDF